MPAWAQSALDEVADRYPAESAEVAESQQGVDRDWAELQARVFDPVSEGFRRDRVGLTFLGAEFPPWDMACNVVLKCALVWVIRYRRSAVLVPKEACVKPPESADPKLLKRSREVESQLFTAERAMQTAGVAFVQAVNAYRNAVAAHEGLPLARAAIVDVGLGETLYELAGTHFEWAGHVGLEDGLLSRVLAITDEMSGMAPTVGDVVQAMTERCGQWQVPTYRGSSPKKDETLIRPFIEALHRLADEFGCPDSGPLAWLNDEQLAFLLQVVRGEVIRKEEVLPSRDQVRNARKAFHAWRASSLPCNPGEVPDESG